MSALAWWVLPVVATALAIGYISWRSRPGPPQDTHDAIEAREKFRRAMEKDVAPRRRRGRRRGPASDAQGSDATP